MNAYGETLRKAYLDGNRNVHIVNDHGRDTQITNEENAEQLKLANDKETVAWLIMNIWTAEGDDEPGSEELIIYRNGKPSLLKCTPFIRNYRFWMNGNQIAIDCGARHFAGHEILDDTKTMQELSSFDEAAVPSEKRPNWSDTDN
jgi:hypothetical protein